MVSYNTNIDIKQIENILRIKFNTTNYKSKLEYQLALIDEEYNIVPMTIHKKFYENNLIYKNTIYSTGKEPIETNITLKDDNFTYDKNYTLIAFGKDIYGEKVNFFYMEPKTLFISALNNKNINEGTIAIEQTYITNEINEPNITIIDEITNQVNKPEESSIEKSSSDKSIIEPSITISDNVTDEENESNQKKKSEGNKKALIIVFSIIGGIIIIGASIGLIIYCKKKRYKAVNNKDSNTFINLNT